MLHEKELIDKADQHNFPGMGIINWPEVKAALQDIGFDGAFSLEVNHTNRFSESYLPRLAVCPVK